jgi:GNAT superfamily N-acetyltransferase
MAIEIKVLQDAELEAANNFFNRIYNTNRSLQNFRWEFMEGPGGKAIYVGAVDTTLNNKIVGIQCAIPIHLISTDGERVLTAKSEDTLVDPSYRGQKIFDRMYDLLFEECRKQGIHAIWGFTPAKKAFEKIGFEIPFSSSQALLTLNPFKAYAYLKNLNTQNKVVDRIKILGLCFLSWIKGGWYYFISADGFSLEPATLSDKSPNFQRLYQGRSYYTLDESTPYLNWRIKKNPFGNDYRSFSMASKEGLIGDAIVNVRREVSYIERIFIKEGHDALPLIKLLVKKLKKAKSPLIRVLCFDFNDELAAQNRSLVRGGFTLLNRGNFFVWKSLTDSHPLTPHKLLLNRLFTQGNQ